MVSLRHHHSVPQRHLKVFFCCCCCFKFLIVLDRFFSPIFSVCFTSKPFSIPHVLWKRFPHLNYTVNSEFFFPQMEYSFFFYSFFKRSQRRSSSFSFFLPFREQLCINQRLKLETLNIKFLRHC